MSPKTERLELRLETETLMRLDDWRAARPDLPSRAEAARQLLDIGIGSAQDEQLFQIARFNLLAAARTTGPAGGLSEAYIYAWERRVFPFFHDGTRLHQPFAAHFQVTEEMMDELTKFLDDRWRAKNVPTFYGLEDRYRVRSGRSLWDRSTLIGACRYMWLLDSFDQEFWDALLRGSDHPTEAQSIRRKFDAANVELG